MGKIKHILRPYRTWNSPLAMPKAGDDTATCTDAILNVILDISVSFTLCLSPRAAFPHFSDILKQL